MIRSLYLTGTNMIVQRRKMDVVTNNIANVETTGFKADSLASRSFADMLLTRVGDPAILYRYNEVGSLNTGVHIDEVLTNFEQGAPQETSNPSDMCLIGEGFFVISTPQGERYTRDGSFMVDRDGYLVTSEGNFVLGTNGLIRVDRENFTVDTNGNITSPGYNPGSFRIVTFEDLSGLRKEGSNLYSNFFDQPVQDATDYEVRQSYVEGSNVQITSEIVDMMTLYRNYETSQRIMQMLDSTLDKCVNEVGRL